MTVDLGQPIAYGRTAEIYAWHPAEVLKLFYDWFGLENIEKEARIARAVHASGLPAPAVGDIICMNNRYGLIYERVNGVSMMEMGKHKPWNAFHYGRRMAELHVELHATPIQADLPSQRHELKKNIQQAEALSAYLRSKILAALESLPDGDRLCHGDFHPGNILMTAQGEIIIDWIHATRGNPLADLARTTNLAVGLTQTSQMLRPFLSFGTTKTSQIKNLLFQILGRISYPAYLNYYFKLCPGGEAEYHRWLPIVAAARLSDNIPELEKMLLVQVKRNL